MMLAVLLEPRKASAQLMPMMLEAGPADAHDAGRAHGTSQSTGPADAHDARGLVQLMLMMLAVPLEACKPPAQLMLMMLEGCSS